MKRAAWVLLGLFLALLLWRGPELFANNKPLLARVDGQWHAPALWASGVWARRDWPELEKSARKKKGYVNVRRAGVLSLLGAQNGFWWPPLARHPNDIPQELAEPPPTPPGMNGRWLGTDGLGRDLAARMVYAVRLGVVFSALVVGISWAIGVLVGAARGYFGGWFDMAVSRVVEIIMLFPKFLLLLTLLALLDKPGFGTLAFVFLISSWIPYQRYVRAEALKERRTTYMEAAKALGASPWRVLWRHLLPNTVRPTLVLVPFDLADTILALSGLSYLGFGTPPPTPDLGEMLDQATQNLPYGWWLAVYPGLTLFFLLLTFNAMGEWVRRRMPQRKA